MTTILHRPLTPWITREGAEKILHEAGITYDPHPFFGSNAIANRTRSEYVHGLLFEVAYAVAERSADPASLKAGGEDQAYFAPIDDPLMKWARRASRQLEKLLDRSGDLPPYVPQDLR